MELIEAGLDYLDPVWENDDWRLFRVEMPAAVGAAAVGTDWFEIDARRPGDHRLAIEFTPWWRVVEGSACVREADDGSTVVEAAAPGRVRVEARLGGDSCSG